MKLTIRLEKRKKPIPEFEQFAQSTLDLKKQIFIWTEATRLRIQYGMILATPAKEIKKMKLRQIKKDLEFLIGDPKAKVNYEIAGIIDSKED